MCLVLHTVKPFKLAHDCGWPTSVLTRTGGRCCQTEAGGLNGLKLGEEEGCE